MRPDPVFHLLLLKDRNDPVPRPSQIIASYGGARVIEDYGWANAGRDAAGERWRRIIALHEILIRYFRGEPGVEPLTRAQIDELGTLLFGALLPGAIGRLYDEARGEAEGRLDLVIASQVGRWAQKPWELAFDAVRGTFLALADAHLLRDVVGAITTDRAPAHAAPLRILIVHAQPIDASALSVDEEITLIRRPFEALVAEALVTVDVLARASPLSLQRALERDVAYDVLHFIGHGEYDEAADTGRLVFEDATGRAQGLADEQLTAIIAGRGIRLVFLNACETGIGGYADFTRGVAPALLAAGVPAVVANQFSVLDSAALTFARELYARLACGVSVSSAVREARIALRTLLDGDAIDWAVPTLFTRVPDLRLVAERTPLPAVALEVAPPLPPARRGPRVWRVALWDMARRLPGLQRCVAQLNAAQDAIVFELVELSVPLDARVVRKVGRGRSAYLDAARAAARLGAYPARLGVDDLIGFTAHPMIAGARTGDGQAFRELTPAPGPGEVAIYSYAGFECGKGDDAIVPRLVAAIAGLLAGRAAAPTAALDAILALVPDVNAASDARAATRKKAAPVRARKRAARAAR